MLAFTPDRIVSEVFADLRDKCQVTYFIRTYILIEKGDENTGLSPIHMIYWGNFNWFDSEQEFG